MLQKIKAIGSALPTFHGPLLVFQLMILGLVFVTPWYGLEDLLGLLLTGQSPSSVSGLWALMLAPYLAGFYVALVCADQKPLNASIEGGLIWAHGLSTAVVLVINFVVFQEGQWDRLPRSLVSAGLWTLCVVMPLHASHSLRIAEKHARAKSFWQYDIEVQQQDGFWVRVSVAHHPFTVMEGIGFREEIVRLRDSGEQRPLRAIYVTGHKSVVD